MRNRFKQSAAAVGAVLMAFAVGTAVPAVAEEGNKAASQQVQQDYEQMQARMQTMHALMTQISQATDPAVRRRLMSQQMQLMQAQMHDMGMMNDHMMGHGAMGCGAADGSMMESHMMHMQSGTRSQAQ